MFWEESLPLPEFPPNPDSVVRPSDTVPFKVKEKSQEVTKSVKVPIPIAYSGSFKVSRLAKLLLFTALTSSLLFAGSFLSAKFFLVKKGKSTVSTSTSPLPLSSSPSPLPSLSPFTSPEVSILLPQRISSAIIPLPPSTIPADLTKNWDLYINPTFRFSFKYPKEWFINEFNDSSSFIVKLSYPVQSSQIGSFAPGETAYLLVSWEDRKGATLESFLSAKYDLSILKKEEIVLSGKKGWRFHDSSGKGKIVAFFEHGQKIISVEGGVKDIKEFSVYQDIFILIQNTFVFS